MRRRAKFSGCVVVAALATLCSFGTTGKAWAGLLETQSNEVPVEFAGGAWAGIAGWTDLPQYPADPVGDASPDGYDWYYTQVAHNDDWFFIHYHNSHAFGGGRQLMYFDTDLDRNTGFPGFTGNLAIGVDFYLDGAALWNSSFTFLDYINWNNTQDGNGEWDIFIAINRAAFLPGVTGFNFVNQNHDGAGDDWYPDAGNSGAGGDYFQYTVAPLDKATDPDPANGEADVEVGLANRAVPGALSWTAPAEPNVPVTYNVYFDTIPLDANSLPVSSDQPGTSYAPTLPLSHATDYYWRVDVLDPNIDPNSGQPGTNPIVVEGSAWTFATVSPDVVITTQPVGKTVPAGTNDVTFSVTAVNVAVGGYQWRKDGVDLANGGKYSGVNTAMLVVDDVQLTEEGNYSCYLTNVGGGADAITNDAQLLTCRLISHWLLDGDLVDIVGGFNGTVPDTSSVGAAFVAGIDGQAYGFTGDPNNNFVEIVGSNDYFNFYTRGFSVAAWVQDNTSGSYEGIIAKQTADESAGWLVDSEPGGGNGNPIISIRGSAYLSPGISATDGAWHHVVAIYDATAGEVRLYQDGVLTGTSATFGAVLTGDAPITFGAEALDDQDPFDGNLDDVRIYSCPLTAIEVATLYTDIAGGEICVDTAPLNGFDTNGDCVVNVIDFAAFAETFLTNCNVPNLLNCGE